MSSILMPWKIFLMTCWNQRESYALSHVMWMQIMLETNLLGDLLLSLSSFSTAPQSNGYPRDKTLWKHQHMNLSLLHPEL